MGIQRIPRIDYVPDRGVFLKEICRDKIVLHLGCASAIDWEWQIRAGRHVHINLVDAAKEVHGVDKNAAAIRRLEDKLQLKNLHVGNVEDLHLPIDRKFDIIVAGELIEQLNNPGLFLSSVSKYMTADTHLVLTTPNMYSAKLFLHTLYGDEAIATDLCLVFSFALLNTLLTRHDYTIVDWKSSVQRFSSRRNQIANILFRPFFRLWPRYADTLIVVAKRRVDSGNTG